MSTAKFAGLGLLILGYATIVIRFTGSEMGGLLTIGLLLIAIGIVVLLRYRQTVIMCKRHNSDVQGPACRYCGSAAREGDAYCWFCGGKSRPV